MPFSVTLIRVASVPLILMPVYPTPFPASELTTTDGVWLSNSGRSCPKLIAAISCLFKFVFAKGAVIEARIDFTSKGCKNKELVSNSTVTSKLALVTVIFDECVLNPKLLTLKL